MQITQQLHLDAKQEKSEQHSEPYLNTVKRAAQLLPQLCAKSMRRILSSAQEQALVVEVL